LKKIDFKPIEAKEYTGKKSFEPTYGKEFFGRNFIRKFKQSNKEINYEFSLDKVMGRKIRINTISEMRNGLPLEVPGDKIYRNPECLPGFFKDRGLIVGSTNKTNYSKTVGKKAKIFMILWI